MAVERRIEEVLKRMEQIKKKAIETGENIRREREVQERIKEVRREALEEEEEE